MLIAADIDCSTRVLKVERVGGIEVIWLRVRLEVSHGGLGGICEEICASVQLTELVAVARCDRLAFVVCCTFVARLLHVCLFVLEVEGAPKIRALCTTWDNAIFTVNQSW